MFCPSFGQNSTRQNKGKWAPNVLFRGAINTVCRGILEMQQVQITRWSKLHGPPIISFSYQTEK
jgi:hypothetical protein